MVCWIALMAGGCEGLEPEQAGDAALLPDARTSENTSALCRDGQDNDHDGNIDCADQDCWDLHFCRDTGAAPQPDQRPADLPAADLIAPDDLALADAATPQDVALPPDSPPPDLLPPDSVPHCTAHCDCAQGSFCHLGLCTKDAKFPVYCCGKPGCPPGRWCVDLAGKRASCGEDPSHACKDACDCGPAHCCKNGVCVKDLLDPGSPGGKLTGKVGCKEGVDATYCCADPSCTAGRLAYVGNVEQFFRCLDRAKGTVETRCSVKSCFGTACNCAAGEVCLDTLEQAPPGKTCSLRAGGTCASHAVASALFGFKPADLLPCCKAGCPKGTKCDAGWRSDSRYSFVRVTGSCGSCGDGKCDPGEYPGTCPKDCSCGDGRCAPAEVVSCTADCGSCGNQVCEPPWENPKTCAKDCPGACGDGWCVGGETAAACPKDCANWCQDTPRHPGKYRVCGDGVCQRSGCEEPETCLTCPGDCGQCDGLVKVHGSPAWTSVELRAIWGSSPTHVLAVGGDLVYPSKSGTVVRFDGIKWSLVETRSLPQLNDIWGSSATDIHVVGDHGTILHFDGAAWRRVKSNAVVRLFSVWGSSANNIIAGGDIAGGTAGQFGIVLRYDGKQWSVLQTGAIKQVYGVWTSSAKQIIAVGRQGSILHHDGIKWRPAATGTTEDLYGVWGASANEVFAVGNKGLIMHFDGIKWRQVKSPTTSRLVRVWGLSASEVYASSYQYGEVLRFDGKQWGMLSPGKEMSVLAVWGTSKTNLLGAGLMGTITRRGAKQWQTMHSGAMQLTGIWGSSASSVSATAAMVSNYLPCHPSWARGGGILSSTGKDWSWSYRAVGSYKDLAAVWGTAAGATAVGNVGTILDQVGSSWKPAVSGTKRYLTDVWGTSASDVYAVGSAYFSGRPRTACAYNVWGELVRFDGTAWSVSLQSIYAGFNGVWGASASQVFIVGVGGVAYRGHGKSWQTMTTNTKDTLHDIWGSSASDVLAVGLNGTLIRYDGKAWVPLQSGTKEHLIDIWGTSPTHVFVLGINGSLLVRQGSGLRPARYDLREPSAGGHVCPRIRALGGTSSGALYLVGDRETVVRVCPQGACP